MIWVFEDRQVFKWHRLEGRLVMDHHGQKDGNKKPEEMWKAHLRQSRQRVKILKTEKRELGIKFLL